MDAVARGMAATALAHAPFTTWNLRAQRLIKNYPLSQGQYPNNSPLTVTVTQSAANPASSSIVTDAGVTGAVTPFLAPSIPLGDARITLVNSFNMTGNSNTGFQPSYQPLETNNAAAMGWAFEFATDAEAVGICVRGGPSEAIRVKVDGQWVGAAQVIVNNTANFYEIKYSLGTGNGGPHVWKVYSTYHGIPGINVGLAAGSTLALDPYTIWAVSKADTPLAVIYTDSYGGAQPLDTSTSDPHQPFPAQFPDWMGWDGVLVHTAPGQGYSSPSSASGLTLSQSLTEITNGLPLAKSADLVMVLEGYNDITTYTAGTVTTSSTATLAAVRALYPNAFIAVWGTWNNPVKNGTTAYDSAIAAGVTAQNDPYMHFFSTMGQFGNAPQYQFPANSAWVAKYMQADNIHESDVGARRLSLRMANDLVVWLRTMTGITHAQP